jgi:hypothetical protein
MASMIYSESDVTHAVEMARSLGTFVVQYLKLFRDNVNGMNGVTISNNAILVSYPLQKKEGYLTVLVHEKSYYTSCHEESNAPGYGVHPDDIDEGGYK